MNFALDLLDDTTTIQNKILEVLKKQLQKTINKSLPKITQDIKNIVSEALRSEPEYSSLKSGTLKAEFGIYNTNTIDNVIYLMVDTLEITSNPIIVTNKGLSGGFKLTMIKSDDINGIIYNDNGVVIDPKEGYVLPWLEWLLLTGGDTIVQNYSVNYTNSVKSRSGLAIMVPSNSDWAVPPVFQGTQDNNWTTRAIQKSRKQIINSIITHINSSL